MYRRPVSPLQHIRCKVGTVEFEMPLVVEFEEGGGVWMLLLQMKVVHLRLLGGVATILTYIHL